jgi:hypothetical protein
MKSKKSLIDKMRNELKKDKKKKDLEKDKIIINFEDTQNTPLLPKI